MSMSFKDVILFSDVDVTGGPWILITFWLGVWLVNVEIIIIIKYSS